LLVVPENSPYPDRLPRELLGVHKHGHADLDTLLQMKRGDSKEKERWTLSGVHLPQQPLNSETVAAIIRITGGNFRLVNRPLTKWSRFLKSMRYKRLAKRS
jgi:hypothetical protein